MEQRYCTQCKLNKNVNEFERYGRTYRRVCRSCRGAIITGVTTANVAAAVQNVIQQQHVSITETVSRTETRIQDIIGILETQQEERVRLIESELQSLREINSQLIVACRNLTERSERLVEQAENINEQMDHVLEKMDDVIVMCRDPAIQNEIRAIANALTVIHANTKPKNISILQTRSPPSSPLNSAKNSPAGSPNRR